MDTRTRTRTLLGAAGLLAAGTVAGMVVAGTLSASAATTADPSASPSAASGTGAPPKAGNPGGANPVRNDEKAVSAADAATLKAAALKAVPGGTVIRVETDAGDGVYEAHLRKADGTLVTVKFDKNMAVTKVESGMGQGDPQQPHG